MVKYVSFLGCMIPLRLPSIEIAAKKVFEKTGIEAVDLEGYSCCPEPVISRLIDQKAWLAAAARNLAMAEEKGLDLMTLCNGCYETLIEANETLKHDPKMLKETNQLLSEFGKQYKGTIDVKHAVEVLAEDIGFAKLKELVKKPQKIKVAMHYGCHLYRGHEGEDMMRKPNMMKQITQVTGATVVDYGLEKLCCGYPSMQADEEFSLKERLALKLKRMEDMGAEAVVLTCPACIVKFETGQVMLRRYSMRHNLPCINIMELLALSFGVPSKELSLDFHRSPVLQLAQKMEAI